MLFCVAVHRGAARRNVITTVFRHVSYHSQRYRNLPSRHEERLQSPSQYPQKIRPQGNVFFHLSCLLSVCLFVCLCLSSLSSRACMCVCLPVLLVMSFSPCSAFLFLCLSCLLLTCNNRKKKKKRPHARVNLVGLSVCLSVCLFLFLSFFQRLSLLSLCPLSCDCKVKHTFSNGRLGKRH